MQFKQRSFLILSTSTLLVDNIKKLIQPKGSFTSVRYRNKKGPTDLFAARLFYPENAPLGLI
jgi:hypothetical protein